MSLLSLDLKMKIMNKVLSFQKFKELRRLMLFINNLRILNRWKLMNPKSHISKLKNHNLAKKIKTLTSKNYKNIEKNTWRVFKTDKVYN